MTVIFLLETKRRYGRLSYSDDRLFIFKKNIAKGGKKTCFSLPTYALLNVDKRENEIVGGEPDEGEELPEKKPRDLER